MGQAAGVKIVASKIPPAPAKPMVLLESNLLHYDGLLNRDDVRVSRGERASGIPRANLPDQKQLNPTDVLDIGNRADFRVAASRNRRMPVNS